MRRNVTAPDRVVRVVVGVLLLGLFGAVPPPWQYLTLIGLIPLGTGITGICPAYAAMRWNRQVTPGRSS
jgi:hypothetical protein